MGGGREQEILNQRVERAIDEVMGSARYRGEVTFGSRQYSVVGADHRL
jgi:hypothetical protein